MKQRQVGDIVILTPKGQLTSGDKADEVEQAIRTLIEGGNRRLVLNLGETSSIGAHAMSVLLSVRSHYVRLGGKMKLCLVDKKIENIFVITKLRVVFDDFPDETEAIASFADAAS